MQPRAHEDAEPLLQKAPRLRRIHPFHQEGQDRGAAGGIQGTEQGHARNLPHACQELGKQRRFLLPHGFHPFAQQPGEGDREARKADAVARPRLEGVGEEIRLAVVLRTGARPPFDEGRKGHSFPHVEETGPLGAEKPLVPRGGEQVDRKGPKVYRNSPSGLGRIHKRGDSAPARRPHDLPDGLDRARDVGSVHDGDQARRLSYGGGHVPRIDDAVFAGGDDRNGYAPILHAAQRPHNGVVLDGRGHHVVAGLEQSLYRLVEGGGRVLREDETGAVAGAEQLRQPLARDEDVPRGAKGQRMAGAAGVSRPPYGGGNRVRYAVRLWE